MSTPAPAVPPSRPITSIPVPRDGTAGLPRRTTGHCADGRPWNLRTDATSVTATTTAGTVAEAHVSERADLVVVEFWADPVDLPSTLGARLVDEAFALPAVRPDRPVLVCVSRRDGAVLEEARRHVADAHARAAGVTCLIEGRVGEDPAAGRA